MEGSASVSSCPLVLETRGVKQTHLTRPSDERTGLGLGSAAPQVSGKYLPDAVMSKTEAEVGVSGNGDKNSGQETLTKRLLALLHFFAFMAYDLSSFIWIVALTFCIVGWIPEVLVEKLNLAVPINQALATFLIYVLLVAFVQVPTEKTFCRNQWVAPYLKTVGQAPLAVFLISATQVFCLGVATASMVLLYEFKLCRGIGVYLLDVRHEEVGESFLVILLYVSAMYPLGGFVRAFQWLRRRHTSNADVLWGFITFVFKSFIPCAKIPMDPTQYSFALVFELAEFIGAILIPTYMFKLWHQSWLATADTIQPNSRCAAYLYFIAAWAVVTCTASFLISVENKVGLWRHLRKEFRARLLVTLAIFIISLVDLLNLYFTPSTEKADKACLLDGQMSIYSTAAVKYIVVSSFCVYSAFKTLLILLNESEYAAKIELIRKNRRLRFVSVDLRSTSEPIAIGLQKKKTLEGKPSISGAVYHHV